MCLRLHEGMSLARYAELSGAPFDMARARPLTDQGLLEVSGSHVRATPKGRPVLNALIAELLT